MNRLEKFVKRLPESEQKRVRFAVRELLLLVCKIEGWQNIDMMDLLDAVTNDKEKNASRNNNGKV